MHPAEQWFQENGRTALPFQRVTWEALESGRSGLLSAPTGYGKTAAVLGGLLKHMDADLPPAVLWITPLRALSKDSARSIQDFFSVCAPHIRVGAQSGDTEASRKRANRTNPPHLLVTTPESASVMLSQRVMRQVLSEVRVVVVDEWHELLSTKRGTQTELVLAALRTMNPDLIVWGLSATLGDREHAAEVLAGGDREFELVSPEVDKRFEIDLLLPEYSSGLPLFGHFGGSLVREVVEQIETEGSTLLFTNTRNQAERWYREIISLRPDWEDQTALHHGSIDADARLSVEEGLRNGQLACVVCTSSLDLGVDFSPVKQVIQVGSPKGIARLLQRAGRSGHQPGEVSRVIGVPTHALELLEFMAAEKGMKVGKIEPRRALEKPLDVLAQHVVTSVLSGKRSEEDLFREAKGCFAYRNLQPEEWSWVVSFLTQGGDALRAYPEYRKLKRQDGYLSVKDNRVAKRHRMSIGTITSDEMVEVGYARGGSLGMVEERFIAQLKPGDLFFFAGKLLSLVQFREAKAVVKKASGKEATVPRWVGGRMPLSSELAQTLQQIVESRDLPRGEPLRGKIQELYEVQERWSALPRPGELLFEQCRVRRECLCALYPFSGRLAHEGLGAVLAYRIQQQFGTAVDVTVNDYGVNLITTSPLEVDEGEWRRLLSPDGLSDDILASLNATELARRKFREIARVAGLVFSGYPGSQKSMKQVQVSSGLLFDVLKKYDEGNLLIAQSFREVLERELEYSRVEAALIEIQKRAFRFASPKRLTPFLFPLWAENISSRVKAETAQTRLEKIAHQLEDKRQSE